VATTIKMLLVALFLALRLGSGGVRGDVFDDANASGVKLEVVSFPGGSDSLALSDFVGDCAWCSSGADARLSTVRFESPSCRARAAST